MQLKNALITAALATAMAGQAHAALATFITSSPYSQFSDSPFAAFASGNPNFYLEDFEDGALNTPGVTANIGGVAVGPNQSLDSVDGDDGVLDGNGNNGNSWYPGGPVLSFSFNAAVLGSLPTHVGIVWTDIGLNGPNGVNFFDDIQVRVFDTNGVSLGGVLFDHLGDGNVSGGTAEDVFFGAIFAGGISRMTITSVGGAPDWEVDHLQYGIQAVPVPGAAWLLAPALAGLMGLRRKRA